jgi:putative Holliday junction resolvase
MRWLAIDHGTKKIGLAFSDELEILASPFEVWPQEEARTLERLARLCKEEGVQALAMGLPRHKDGAESATAPAARAFGEALAGRTGLPLRFVNEHLSTAEAEREKRKAMLDAAAAAVILSELLDDRRAKGIPLDRLD